MKNNKTLYNKAFTLIELLVVIAIISLLSALVLNSLASARMKANDTKIAEDLRQFRIAAELYYNDNHAYPPGYTPVASLKRQNTITQTTHSWSNKLSFFVKTAEAAINHQTPLCANFDAMATEMVSKKYLAAVPVHPYDDDAEGICYKAINATSTYAAYAALTTQVSIGGENFNKRTGFILGDTSSKGLIDLSTAKDAIDSEEEDYPIDANGDVLSNIGLAADSVAGITSGASAVPTGLMGIIYKIIPPPLIPVIPPPIIIPPPPTSSPQELCTAPGECTWSCLSEWVFLQDGNQNTASGTCSPIIYCPAIVGIHYDPVTNTCIDERLPNPPGGGESL
jgi:prepilin-type N-terminal cleavage/methylation domain-containing protein